MKTRIYVGNLAYTATAIDIRSIFEPFGEVAAAHVFTAGKSRVWLVLINKQTHAESPLESVNCGGFLGRELVVQWAAKQRRTRVLAQNAAGRTAQGCPRN
jgi:hypothetical protein